MSDISISASVILRNVVLPMDRGYVGRIEEVGSVILKVTAPREAHCFTVDRNKNIFPVDSEVTNGTERVHQLGIPIVRDNRGTFCTLYPDNNLRLLSLQNGNIISIFEIALVSQGGDFYITKQPTYEAELFRNKAGEICCPTLNNWPAIIPFLNDLFGENPNGFISIAEYVPKQEKERLPLEKNIGVVIWYNIAQGLGAIQTGEGVARVHWSQIRMSGFVFLIPGEYIMFSALRSPRQGSRPTSFNYEAIDVVPLSR